MQILLLTGFQSYGGRTINPAEEIVKSLNGKIIGGQKITGKTLPVNYNELKNRMKSFIEDIEPQAVICLGLWPGEMMLRIERIAVNISDFEIPDNFENFIKDPVDSAGPAGYESTLPIEEIRNSLLEHQIPARLSGTAGHFLCNALMYHALNICSTKNPSPKCGFIHLPYAPEQVADVLKNIHQQKELELHQRADLASMSLEQMRAGIEVAIGATLESLSDG